MRDKTNKIVLVAVLKNKRDLNILLNEGWYRIPARQAPKRPFAYLAFYQPAIFGRQGKRIKYYARVLSSRNFNPPAGGEIPTAHKLSVCRLDQIGVKTETTQPSKTFEGCLKGDSARPHQSGGAPIWNYQITKRKDLLPRERGHPRAGDDYFKIRLGKIKELPQPIRNIIPRRICFGFTTLDQLLKSKSILQLYKIVPTEQIVEDGLKRIGIKYLAQHPVVINKPGSRAFASLPGKKRFRLDLAIFCQNGKIAIECDNKKAHASLAQRKRDKIKDAALRQGGWKVIRLSENKIVSDLKSCVERVKKTIQKLNGL